MKAIVANVLLGGIFGCLSWANSAEAHTLSVSQPASIISFKFSPEKLPVMPKLADFLSDILKVDKLKIEPEKQYIWRDNLDYQIIPQQENFDLGKGYYIYEKDKSKIILGLQDTFWSTEKKQQYWGITTIRQWGKNSDIKVNLSRLNYLKSAPILAAGSSALTISGGGEKNLTKRSDYTQEIKQLRGGITYHRGIVKQVTMGVGVIYDDFLTAFTQLTYKSDRLPIETTLSLLAKDSQVNFYSHIRYKPTQNIILNYYYNQQKKQQFDFSWKVISGLTFTAKGNTKNDSLTTGVKVAINNPYLNISANAAVDNNNNVQWNLKSQIGSLQLIYNSTQQQRTSELNIKLINSQTLKIQCVAFIKYDDQIIPNQQDFTVWGGKFQSINKKDHQWSVELGIGSGSYGQGLIASGYIALKPNLDLRLTYQGISAISDETKFKLQLKSKNHHNNYPTSENS
ncbi:hypothetical protein NIES4102_08640 [Chondrocystis sp. NIES-4102]|nr:hypothetical protein NIES4102_08640 [Chondrocystis sp. NIES-4102]